MTLCDCASASEVNLRDIGEMNQYQTTTKHDQMWTVHFYLFIYLFILFIYLLSILFHFVWVCVLWGVGGWGVGVGWEVRGWGVGVGVGCLNEQFYFILCECVLWGGGGGGGQCLNEYSQVSVIFKLEMRDDDVISWKHSSRYWPFMRGIHRASVDSSHKAHKGLGCMPQQAEEVVGDWRRHDVHVMPL